MPNNLKKNVLLIGATQMAIDYYNVLKTLNCNITVVGKSTNNAKVFFDKTGCDVLTGGVELFLKNNTSHFDAAIIAVGIEVLAATAMQLINANFKHILIEKPASIDLNELKDLANLAKKNNANLLIAYNRRFLASVLAAKQIIQKDGGVISFNFEFTEWAHTIEPLIKKKGIKKNWLIANSTHVIDLAFYLGGKPTNICSFTSGKLSWHDKAIFSGAGKTNYNALFSYQANWMAPGRWAIEILTLNSRLILKPLEELQIQLKGSVAINKVQINNEFDVKFKPGLYEQTNCFLNQNYSSFITIDDQVEMFKIYKIIAEGNANTINLN